MPSTDAIVTTRFRMDPGDAAGTVELEDGRRARLDPEDRRSAALASVLGQLRQLGRPVYLEIDPDTDLITTVRVPAVGRVVAVTPRGPEPDAGLAVELDASHAVHVLRPDTAGAEGFLEVLREAETSRRPVVLTVDDAHTVIDVRAFTPDPERPLPLPPPRPGPGPRPPWPLDRIPGIRRIWPWLDRFWWWTWWPWWWFRAVSPARAQQIIDAMAATTCAPLTVPAPCIPFMFPDDGCWARAHEMCRLMLGTVSVSPRKVWIDHSPGVHLHVATRNHPSCYVEWGWHVAPTLLVRGPWFLWSRMVIDPALFTTPVSQQTWKGVQGDPAATLTPTGPEVFWHGGGTDPTYAQSDAILAQYRLELRTRSLQIGPPPYAYC